MNVLERKDFNSIFSQYVSSVLCQIIFHVGLIWGQLLKDRNCIACSPSLRDVSCYSLH